MKANTDDPTLCVTSKDLMKVMKFDKFFECLKETIFLVTLLLLGVWDVWLRVRIQASQQLKCLINQLHYQRNFIMYKHLNIHLEIYWFSVSYSQVVNYKSAVATLYSNVTTTTGKLLNLFSFFYRQTSKMYDIVSERSHLRVRSKLDKCPIRFYGIFKLCKVLPNLLLMFPTGERDLKEQQNACQCRIEVYIIYRLSLYKRSFSISMLPSPQ